MRGYMCVAAFTCIFGRSDQEDPIFFTFGEIGATMRVRDNYFRICTVYASTGDFASEVYTGCLKYANNNMFSHSHIKGASGDRGMANKLMMLPLRYISSADLSRSFRKEMGLIRTYCCFYRGIEENQS